MAFALFRIHGHLAGALSGAGHVFSTLSPGCPFQEVPATFPGTLSIRYKYPLPHSLALAPSLSLFPRPKVSGCFTQIVAALGELSFWCAAPSSLCSLEVGGWRWYHPQSVYCFWCFGSFLVIRFVLFHLQLHFHLFPFPSPSPSSISGPSISHFSHFVGYCVAFCASLFVHFHSCPAPGRCIIKRCFFVAPPPLPSLSKGAYRLWHSCDSLPASSLAAPQL